VYAVNNGFLDHVHVPDVVAWENKMHTHMMTSEKELLSRIEKGWDDEIENNLKEVLTTFSHMHGKEA
jgi:F0F1-type ATP synthase alpha subunit